MSRFSTLVLVSSIIETEEHNEIDAMALAKSISKFGFWTVPIALEKQTLAIMDGHHRFNAAKALGLKFVPCLLFSYEEPGVVVGSWRQDIVITKDVIFANIKLGLKFPYKTTRHSFFPEIDEVKIDLGLLI